MMTLYLSMAGFALAASISPGPVNVVALSSGVSHGLRATLRHVAGATLGFVLLLVLAGLGLAELLRGWPAAAALIRWAGVAFLLWMGWTLWRSDGRSGGGIADAEPPPAPSVLQGAAMQWLNPKAWVAALAGSAPMPGRSGPALDLCRALFRHLLPVRRLLGLCRRPAAPSAGGWAADAAVQPRHGCPARGQRRPYRHRRLIAPPDPHSQRMYWPGVAATWRLKARWKWA